MKTTKLISQKIISQKPIDLENKIFVRFYKNNEEQYGFQYIKFNFNEEIEAFNKSQVNWIYGYFKYFEEAQEKAEQLIASLSNFS